VLRRIGILNSAFYRIISLPVVHLRRVRSANYSEGTMEIIVDAPEADPSIVPGNIGARFEPIDG
jgi:hypothetical protein